MQYLIYLVQLIGILVPLAGIIGLLRRRHQSNNSLHLTVTNMGCLLMNGGYFLALGADTAGEAMLISKMEYLGNALFYYFFVLFLVSYLWDKYPKWPFYIWAFVESAGALLYWNDTLRERFFGNHTFITLEESALLHLNIYTTYMDSNIVYMLRCSGISLALFCLLVVSNVRLFQVKEQAGRGNMARLVGAQFVIMMSLIARVVLKPAFDFVPVLSALAILFVILSVLSDAFYGITEMGHEWVFEQMTDAFFIVDNNYGYLDANSCAREICPELDTLKKGMRIPKELHSLFAGEEEIVQFAGKNYKRKVTDIRDKNKTVGSSLLLLEVTGQQEMNHKAIEQTKKPDKNPPDSFTAPTARILIVDDNEINRMVAAEIIAPLQLQVDTVENGAEALEKVQEVHYDLVLMDHFMPVMDGIEATQAIRKLDGEYYRSLPILAMTANDAEEQQEKYRQAGMNDFIAKPILMKELFAKLKKWLPKEKVNSDV